MNEMLSNKWRPRHFDDFIGHSSVVYVVKNILKNKSIPHSFIISGSYGTGKTTLARILVKCLNCEIGITDLPCDNCYCCRTISNSTNPDAIEVDSASKTRLENVKDLISTAKYESLKNRFRTYIFDECHMLSSSSFNFLLKILEEDKYNIYIFITTNLEKVPDTVRSRCINLHLYKLNKTDVAKRIKHILNVEKFNIQNILLDKIIFFSKNNLRVAINFLEQFGIHRNISENDINNILGVPDDYIILNVLRFLSDNKFKNMLLNLKYMVKNNFNIDKIILDFQFVVYKLILYKFNVKYDKNNVVLFKYVCEKITFKQLYFINYYLLKYKKLIRFSPNDYMGLEYLFINLYLVFHKIN